MRFSHELSHAARPEQVRALLVDRAFREEVCREQRAEDFSVTVDGDAGGLLTVVVRQSRPTDRIPAFAKRLVGDRIEVVQREVWSGSRSADLEVTVPGRPARLTGAVELRTDEAGTAPTVQSVTGDLVVTVPLVGGRIEELVADLLRSAMAAEQRVAARRLRRS